MEENKSKQPNKTLIERLFSCCFNNMHEDYELTKMNNNPENETDNSFILRTKTELEADSTIFPASTIRNEERKIIDYTREGLIKFINSLRNAQYEEIWNKNDLIISKKNSSELSDKIPLIRCQITKNKSFFTKTPSISKIFDSMMNPEDRKIWDSNIKNYKIIEKINNDSDIVEIITNKQLDQLEERLFYDKRTKMVEKGNYILFSSSVSELNGLMSLDYDKGTTYLSVMIVREDKNNLYFDTFNQIDINFEYPKDFFDNILPNKVITFFEQYFGYLNNLK